MTGRRLADGGRIDRHRTISFVFNGKQYAGFAGDTLASALLANNVLLTGRSFKYHRPRGIYTAGPEEPNALVQLDDGCGEPNVRATVLPLHDGLNARSMNCWPSVGFDVGAINSALSPLFPAGFYYKTFMGVPGGWNFFGPIIRRAAGLGRVPESAGEQCYEKRYEHCDMLVVGAGPAGLTAALTAARSGARVILADERTEAGGSLLDCPEQIDGKPAVQWVAGCVAELDNMPNVRRLCRATVAGYYDHNMLTILEQEPGHVHERLWKVRARQVVLATGSIERPLVFTGNDRPGVMLATAALAYATRYAVLAGRAAVVFTNNNGGCVTALHLHHAGIHIKALVDLREQMDPGLANELKAQGIEVLSGHAIVGVRGSKRVSHALVAPRSNVSTRRLIACDLVLSSGGWNPTVHLQSQSGAKPVYREDLTSFVPGPSVQAERSAGAVSGQFDLGMCLEGGVAASRDALEVLGIKPAEVSIPVTDPTPPLAIEPVWLAPGIGKRDKAFVDLQNDVTADDLRLAVDENFLSVEHVKRYTTTGMGTDQGKLSNVNAIGILSGLRDITPDQVGTTTFRPPYTPISFGAIAGTDQGSLVIPSRRTPITDWNESSGAVMFEAGAAFRRPSYYPRAGETAHDAIQREALTARTHVAIYDGTPLGKFELRGPDSVTFLNRVYTNAFDDLAINQGRFGWMLREDGRLQDDGMVFRLGDDHYWLFCGTGAVGFVHPYLERLLQLEWPELRCYLTPVSAQWSNLCVCGPKAREVIRQAGTDIDLEGGAFPFFGLRHGEVAGVPVRAARVSYTGELSFELNARARDGLRLWEALLGAGDEHGIAPMGSEASMVLRCEKGFVSAGFEGDGTVNPDDAGLSWVIDAEKGDFVGKRMLERDRNVGGIRQQVVGLLAERKDFVPPDGTPLVEGVTDAGVPNVIGYVSQGCFSPNLGRSIAMAVLDDGRRRIGSTISMDSVNGRVAAEVTRPCFIDPDNKRMRS